MPLPSVRQMIDRLIAIPSVSSVLPSIDMGNEAVTNQLAEWYADIGFAVEIIAIDGKPGHFNTIATLGKGPGGLVLAGHTDTVPFNESLWDSDPFVASERNGCIFGLGTTDMKAFLALALEAARDFDPSDFNKPLILLATADEESGMSGARALLDARKPMADFAVIGEPTNMRPVRMHKGAMLNSIRLTGRSGHSSDPSLGNNAIEGMYRIIGELLTIQTELQSRYRDDAFHVPVPTLNLGHIHGGDNPNRICGDCELSFDLRPLPGMNMEELRDSVHDRLLNAVRDSGLKLEFTSPFNGVCPMVTAADASIVRTTEKLTGHPAGAVAFGTEAPYFQKMGMEVVVLGPGDIGTAHQPNEYLRLDRIAPTIDMLRALIHQYCIQTTA